MLRSGNRLHFVPSSRSMSPIIARRSYLFGCRSQVNDVRWSAAIIPSMTAPQRSRPICVTAIASERAVNDSTIANRPVTGAHYLRLRHYSPGCVEGRFSDLRLEDPILPLPIGCMRILD